MSRSAWQSPDEVKRQEATLAGAVNRRIGESEARSGHEGVRSAGGRPVIDTSFNMDDGETVVVGTSPEGRQQGANRAAHGYQRSSEGVAK